jgi:hypothetical protein
MQCNIIILKIPILPGLARLESILNQYRKLGIVTELEFLILFVSKVA